MKRVVSVGLQNQGSPQAGELFVQGEKRARDRALAGLSN